MNNKPVAPLVEVGTVLLKEFLENGTPNNVWSFLMDVHEIKEKGWLKPDLFSTYIHEGKQYKVVYGIISDLPIRDNPGKLQDTIFANCEFDKFEVYNISAELIFINCDFAYIRLKSLVDKSRLLCYGCEIKKITASASRLKYVYFSSCRLEEATFTKCFITNRFVAEITRGLSLYFIETNLLWVTFRYVVYGTLDFKDSVISNELFVGDESRIYILSLWNAKTEMLRLGQECFTDQLIINGSAVQELLLGPSCTVPVLHLIKGASLAGFTADRLSVVLYFLVDASKVEFVYLTDESLVQEFYMLNNSSCSYFGNPNGGHIGLFSVRNSEVREVELADVECRFKLSGATIPVMRLTRSLILSFVWEPGNKADVYIMESTINFFRFKDTSVSKDSLLSIVDTAFFFLSFEQLLVVGQLILRNIKSNSYQMPSMAGLLFLQQSDSFYLNGGNGFQYNTENFKNMCDCVHSLTQRDSDNDSRVISDLAITEPSVRFINSSLGKAEFTGTDLTVFRLAYRNSRLLELFVHGTKFPKEISIYGSASGSEVEEQQAAIHNQFKKIYEGQGDLVAGTLHHSLAMHYQKRLLKDEMKTERSCKRRWGMRLEYLGYKLNQVSNKFGEDWRVALVFVLAVSMLLYIGYYTSVHYRDEWSLSACGDFFKYYFQFLDLTHKYDFMTDKDAITAISVMIDFLGRVFIGYGIFQFIAAFRKHGKKAV